MIAQRYLEWAIDFVAALMGRAAWWPFAALLLLLAAPAQAGCYPRHHFVEWPRHQVNRWLPCTPRQWPPDRRERLSSDIQTGRAAMREYVRYYGVPEWRGRQQ